MKLQTKLRDIERGGLSAETSFTIKTTGKAFDILSSSIYSDKILAIIRELSCNALDAHIEAGKADVPFEIHLPNRLEPYFSVKDWGTGLTDEEIRGKEIDVETGSGKTTKRVGGLYTTYFDSTKTDSNDFVGALGLGSKSPFSYSENFDVLSRKDGVLRIYNIFLNEHQIPTVALASSIETDEENGLEVRMAVQQNDMSSFTDKTRKALRFFKVKPEVKGAAYFSWSNPFPETPFAGDKWALINVEWNDPDLVAIQGHVAYPIDLNMLMGTQEKISFVDTATGESRTKDADDSEVYLSQECFNFFQTMQMALYFDIGDLEVTASREKLQYKPLTRENLVNALEEARKSYAEQIYALFDVGDGVSLWDTFIKFHEIANHSFGSMSKMYKVMELIPSTDEDNPVMQFMKRRGMIETSPKKFEHITADYYTLKSARRSRYQGQRVNDSLRRVTSWDGTVNPLTMRVVVNDVRSAGIRRTADYLKSIGEEAQDVIIINYKKDDQSQVYSQMVQREIDIFQAQLSGAPIAYVSEETEAAQRGSGSRATIDRSTTSVFVLDQSNLRKFGGIRKSSPWERMVCSSEEFAEIADEGGYYVHLKGGTTPIDHRHQEIYTLFGRTYGAALCVITQFLRKHTDDPSLKVYGFSNRPLKKIQRSKRWKPLTQAFERAINSDDYKTMFLNSIVSREAVFPFGIKADNIAQNHSSFSALCDVLEDRLPEDSPFLEIWKQGLSITGISNFPVSVSDIQTCRPYINWKVDASKSEKLRRNSVLMQRVLDRYILMDSVEDHQIRSLLTSYHSKATIVGAGEIFDQSEDERKASLNRTDYNVDKNVRKMFSILQYIQLIDEKHP